MTMHTLKKEVHTLENTAAKLLSMALKAGAEKAEVCGTFGQKTKISLEKQDYHLALRYILLKGHGTADNKGLPAALSCLRGPSFTGYNRRDTVTD